MRVYEIMKRSVMVMVTSVLCLTENKLAKIFILFCFISQHLSGNSDKSSVVVRVFSSPFAAQFIRILPKIYHTPQCMRVDLFGCRDCKCGILCYFRLVKIFKGYYFITTFADHLGEKDIHFREV